MTNFQRFLIALAPLLFMTLCWYVLPAMWRGT